MRVKHRKSCFLYCSDSLLSLCLLVDFVNDFQNWVKSVTLSRFYDLFFCMAIGGSRVPLMLISPLAPLQNIIQYRFYFLKLESSKFFFQTQYIKTLLCYRNKSLFLLRSNSLGLWCTMTFSFLIFGGVLDSSTQHTPGGFASFHFFFLNITANSFEKYNKVLYASKNAKMWSNTLLKNMFCF